MRVLLLTRYGPRGGSSRLRAYQYLDYLESQGIRVTVAALLTDAYLEDLYQGYRPKWAPIVRSYWARLARLLTARSHFDLVWIEYEVFPWVPAFAERWLAARGLAYVVDYDDAVFHRYDLHSRAWVRRLLGQKIDVVMRNARTVIVGNAYLAERARSAGAASIEYLPTVVDLAQYRNTPPPVGPEFTIGWIGSPSTVKYLSLIGGVLGGFCREHSARLVAVGARRVPLDGVPADLRPWSEETEARDVASFDVGIMPVPDEPWERGKCGFKLIQYMAAGRPVIASPVGVNRQIVEHGVNGFLATTQAEWRAALDALFHQPDLRQQFGSAGRRQVEQHYCTRVTAPRLADILRNAAGAALRS